jgi:hypothetical protein
MTWTKLSDDFSDDCWRLSDQAWRLHVEGLIWSNRKLLDLRLLKDEMRLWAKHPEAAAELVAIGWWKDDGDTYVILHHGVYQRPRERVLKQQEVNQEIGRKGGRPSGPPRERAPREHHRGTDSLSDLPTKRDGTGRDRPGLGKQPPTKANEAKTVENKTNAPQPNPSSNGQLLCANGCDQPARGVDPLPQYCYACYRKRSRAGAAS